MKYLLALFMSMVAYGQTGTVKVLPASSSATIVATATTIECNITSNSGRTTLTAACTKSGTSIGTTTLSVDSASEIVTWSVSFGTTDIVTGTFTQAATVGTVTYSVAVNGGTPTTGTF